MAERDLPDDERGSAFADVQAPPFTRLLQIAFPTLDVQPPRNS